MHALQTPLKIGPIPKNFRLRRGQILTCTQGCLWITSDALAGRRDSDVVLESGQSFVTPQAATYFVGAPRGCGVLSFLSPDTAARNSLETTC
jgi:hypothetical protein